MPKEPEDQGKLMTEEARKNLFTTVGQISKLSSRSTGKRKLHRVSPREDGHRKERQTTTPVKHGGGHWSEFSYLIDDLTAEVFTEVFSLVHILKVL